jgi:hypothetical protein
MADDLTGIVWALDTAVGVVTTGPFYVHTLYVRFTTAAAGSFQALTQITAENTSTGKLFCDLTTTATSTANAFNLEKVIYYGGQPFQGLKKTLCVGVETVWIITSPGGR